MPHFAYRFRVDVLVTTTKAVSALSNERGGAGGASGPSLRVPEVFHLGADDELSAAATGPNRGGGRATPYKRETRDASRVREAASDIEVPPWVGVLEGRIASRLAPMQQDLTDINLLHVEMHRELVNLSSEFKNQQVRVEANEAAIKEHSELHEGSLLRIANLERQVRDLRAQSRSPTPSRRGGAHLEEVAAPHRPANVTLRRNSTSSSEVGKMHVGMMPLRKPSPCLRVST